MFPEDKKASLCVQFTTYAAILEYSKVYKKFSHDFSLKTKRTKQRKQTHSIPHIIYQIFFYEIQTENHQRPPCLLSLPVTALGWYSSLGNAPTLTRVCLRRSRKGLGVE